ncbi:MAG TPA: hypothetical protein VFW44_11070 [Bryobacteraceae bacterium]|nr:hypothetical protein [Bryobacteraceae bacterium]
MMQHHGNRPLIIALYANAILLGLILVALVSRGATFGPMAQAQPVPIAGGNGVYVMPAQFLPQLWGCYVLDTNNQTLSTYAFYGSNTKPQLRLIAARNIQWDRELKNFNTEPDPQDIRKLIEVQRAPMREDRQPKTGLTEPKTQPAGDNQ